MKHVRLGLGITSLRQTALRVGLDRTWSRFAQPEGMRQLFLEARPLATGYSRRIVPTVPLHQTGKPIALLIVGEAPGAEEDETGEPFVGRSGQLLRGAYVDHWRLQDHADVFLTNAVRCRPPDNRTPRPGEISAHRAMLVSDLHALARRYPDGPPYVLATGATACKTFGMKSLTDSFKKQGALVPFAGLSVRFFATWHPAFVLRDNSVGTSLAAHLGCLVRHISGGSSEVAVEQTWFTAPSRIDHKGTVCLDIETYGCLAGQEQTQFHPAKALQWDGVGNGRAIISAALSWDGGSAFYNLTLAEHRRALVSVFRQVQQDDSVLLLQNATFDLTFLRAFLPAARPYLDPPTRLSDLMVSSYLVDEARPEKSLKALAPLLIGEQGLYKDEWRSLNFTGPTDPMLAQYNVADTVRTLKCHRLCRESYRRMYGDSTGKGSEYSDAWYSDLLHLVTWMSETGVPIRAADLGRMDSQLAKRKAALESLAGRILDLKLEGKGSDKSKRGAIADAMALVSPDTAARIELTKTGKVPYDNETRALLLPGLSLAGRPARHVRRSLHVMGLHQDVAKVLSTYTGPMLRGRKRGSRIDHSPRIIKGRVYPTWYPVPREFGAGETGGTKQGRLAAKGPSVPTFPPSVKDLIDMDIWVDYSQIELRVAAVLSNDPVMMAEYSGVPDLHSRTAKLIFGDDIVTHPNFKAVYRQAGKVINFLMLYRGGAEKFRESLLRDVGIDFPLEKCYAAIERFWQVYRGLRVWQDGIIDFVRRKGFYELPLTGQSRLFSRVDTPINEVANFPVQTVAANVTLSAQWTLWRTARERGLGVDFPVNIYDAIGGKLKQRSRLRDAQALMEEVLPNPPYYAALCNHLGRSLPLAFEIK